MDERALAVAAGQRALDGERILGWARARWQRSFVVTTAVRNAL